MSYEEFERQIRVASRDKAIENIGNLLKKMKGCLKNLGQRGSTVTAEELEKLRPSTVANGSFQLHNNTYASIVAPPVTNTVVRIRVPWASEIQPSELLSIAQQKIKGAYTIRQMRSNVTEVFVQSPTQRDAVLKIAQLEKFRILHQDFHVEITGAPLSSKIAERENAITQPL
ncbi:hypothetical protein HI914_03755 [Erysiphe necator]|nr:hypothetical protein HI914_03755 [Erysiphe necator]